MAVVINWDTNMVKGNHASILAANPETDDQLAEKKMVENDGENWLSFPKDYQGKCVVTVRGSESGEDEGTIEIGPEPGTSNE